jgi:hypothetical protein
MEHLALQRLMAAIEQGRPVAWQQSLPSKAHLPRGLGSNYWYILTARQRVMWEAE